MTTSSKLRMELETFYFLQMRVPTGTTTGSLRSINEPFTPDLAHLISELKAATSEKDWPVDLSHAMVRTCTNSLYEDADICQQLVAQAKAAGLSKFDVPCLTVTGDVRVVPEVTHDLR